jgi:Cdc6-like AAA superfamily ATPase
MDSELLGKLWSAIIDPKVLAPLSSLLTISGKLIYDRWISEIGVSTETILNDLDKGNFLSAKRRKRLQREADNNLAFWRRDLQPPPSGLKLQSWPENEKAILARNLSTFTEDSACPNGDADSNLTPLFFRLNYNQIVTATRNKNEPKQSQDADMISELEIKFQELEARYKHSKELILHRRFSDKEVPKIWILAANVLIRKREDALDILEKLTETVRKRIPGAKVVLELYLSKDLRNQLAKYVVNSDSGPNSNDLDATTLNNAARYTLAREVAMKALSGGLVLGKLQVPDNHQVPDDLLMEHMGGSLDETILSLEKWNTISISGPPGSGKTELANLMAEKMKDELGITILMATTPQLLEEIERLFTFQSIEEAFQSLVNTIYSSPREDHLIPGTFEGDIWRKAFQDVFYDVLRDKRHPIVILVDDLHAYSAISSTILRLRQQFTHWGLRFILIGRTEVQNLPQERFIPLRCNLWNREQAMIILETWLPTRQKNEIGNILERDWRKEQGAFSLYLLRIIAKHINIVETAPSELLRIEINNLLSSVVKELELQQEQQPASLWLEKVKEMLRSNTQPSEILAAMEQKGIIIDPVLLFGTLSWFSRFDERNALLDASKVLQWGKSFIKDEEAAKALLNAGDTAKVFSGRSGLYIWHDPLVADVCAALYLGHEVIKKGLGDEAVAKMVESLDKSDSIDFLRLALDPEILIRIIQAVTNSRPDLAHVVDKLLSSDFVSRLAEDPRWVNALANDFWVQGRKVNPDKIEPVALALSKLVPLSSELDRRCQEAIKSADSDALLALAIKALQLQDDNKYFKYVEQYAPQYLLPIVAEMSARFWGPQGGNPISDNLTNIFNLGYGEDELRRIWSFWCKRQKSPDLLVTIQSLINQIKIEANLEKVCSILFDECLGEIGNRPPAERLKYFIQINQLKKAVSELARQGLFQSANKLVKWIAYFYSPDIVNKEGNWLVDRKGNFALPKKPNDPLLVTQIFANIRSVYPKFDIAAVGEIRSLAMPEEGYVELVRDRFPSDFSYSEEIMPGILQTWNGRTGTEDSIPKDKIRSLKIAWRPRLNLQIDSNRSYAVGQNVKRGFAK